jgi:hypothetical protein
VLTARRIPRPTPALVVAFAALFTALGGTGYAALKVTGSNVVNSTLTGVDVKTASLGPVDIKKDSLDGVRIDEATLGPVPTAQNAANADAVGGIPAANLMTVKPRAFESSIGAHSNFANNAILATSADFQPGTYVVSASLSYDNDGAAEQESCALHLPGTDDTATFVADTTPTASVVLSEVVTSAAVFNASVSCTGDGDDDTTGRGVITAIRVD